MTVKEVKPKSPIGMIQCQICRLVSARIGDMKDWTACPGGMVCSKDGCRTEVGLLAYVPPDERR